MNVGCCGRPVSLAGLLAEADFYPALSPQGRAVRARLAYTIAAGKAAQAGNRPAYERALSGLRGLGRFQSSDPAFAAASSGVTAAVRTAASSPTTLPQALTSASGYVNLVAGLASLATSIAQSAGGDQNAIDAVNTTVSWIRSLLTGSTPTIPTMSPDLLNGFVDFCRIKPTMTAILYPIIDAVVVGLRAGAIRDPGMGQAADALDFIKGRITTLLDGICNVPQIQAAMTAAPAPTTPPPVNVIFNPNLPGVMPTVRCADGTIIRWGQQCPPPRPSGPSTPAPSSSSSGGVLLPLAAAAIAAKFLLF